MNESSIGTKGESGLKPTPTSESSDNGQIPLDKKSFGSASVEIYQSDILKQSVHAIVNPANTRLQGGGGLDGKIGAAAGQSIYQECAEQLRAAGLDQCDTGDAYITKSGKLAERNISYIIHAVGPRGSTPDGDRLLKAAYSNSLVRAHEMNLNSIAFPGISIGIFNFNPTRAAEIAYEAIEEFFATHPGTSIYDVRLCYWTSKNDQASLERMLELFQER